MGYWQTGCPRDVDVALVRIGAVNAPGYAAVATHVRHCKSCRLRMAHGRAKAVVASAVTAAPTSKVGIGIALGVLVFLIALAIALS